MTRNFPGHFMFRLQGLIALMAAFIVNTSAWCTAQEAPPATPAAPVPAETTPSDAATAPADAVTTAPATTQAVPVDQTTPRGALKVLASAMEAGDKEKILGVFHTTSPLEERMASAMAEMASAVAKLRKVTTEAYGEAGARELIGELPPPGESDRLVDSATETITEKNATVQLGAESPPAKLIQVDGQWKFPVSELAQGVPPEAISRDVEFNMGQAAAIDAIAEEIAQKKYSSAAEVRTALESKLRQLVEERRQPATLPATTAPAGPQPAPEGASQDQPPAAPITETPAESAPAGPATEKPAPATPAPATPAE